MYKQLEQCRLCGGTEIVLLLELGEQYLTGVFPETPNANLTRGPLSLVRCAACGLVQLAHSYDLRELYGRNYGYRSGLNLSMVEHLRRKVHALLALVKLQPGDLVLDIGSNDGTTLSFYPPEQARAGFDPSAEKFRKYYADGVRLVVDFFSAKRFKQEFGSQKAKVVTSIAMFYDLEAPMEFVREIAEILADDGIWHFEQSYMPAMLATNAYDTICHEHLEYYALTQIKHMADKASLKIIDVVVNDINGGSFAVTVTKRKDAIEHEAVGRLLRQEREQGFDTTRPFTAFKDRVFKHRDSLLTVLRQMKREGQLVLGYGASTKGNVILQFCGIGCDLLPRIAEVNETKFGCYTPGTGIPIISETEARAQKPDVFLVLPWHFKTNLVAREQKFLQSGGRMLFPLPEIEVVKA